MSEFILIVIKVLTNKKVNRIKKEMDNGVFCVELKAKPVEGRANRELIRFLSKLLDIPQMQISIHLGINSHHKTIKINSANKEQIFKKLDKLTQSP